MRRYIMMTAAAAAVATLAALSPAAAGAAGHAPRTGSGAPAHAQQAASGAQLWVSRYTGPGSGMDFATSVAVSRTRVFVTGNSWDGTRNDYATVAYSAATGKQLWVRRSNGSVTVSVFQAESVAVNPRGTVVFVTGSSTGRTTGDDYVTVAYSAGTGRQLWARRYNDPRNGNDGARSLAVSPDGTRVFVTGYSWGRPVQNDYVTVAYRAGTGRQLWVRRYNGPGQSEGGAGSIAVNSRGTAVFVTGAAGTVAYRAGTGRQLWVRPYTGYAASSVAVSPGGTAVFVTGTSAGLTGGESDTDYVTVAYSAATGRQLWAGRYNGPANDVDNAIGLAVNPRGTAVYVTGNSLGTTTGRDYATVAYSAATGTQLWARRYNVSNIDEAYALAVNPAGTRVYVTGGTWVSATSYDYTSVAYRASTGRQLWVSRYNGPAKNGIDIAYAVAVSPDGAKVFVAGYSTGRRTSYDYATIAYHG
jgi:putative pyrroloquinoline-quinone binding quinoprotein